MAGWNVLITTLGGLRSCCLTGAGSGNHWLSIALRGTRSNRDGYGARVRVNGQTRLRDVRRQLHMR